MADRGTLEAAVAAGVITSDQVGPLADFLAARQSEPSASEVLGGEENLRFIRNFHDVFLAIGIVLLAIGLAVAIGVNAASLKLPAVITGAMCAGAGIVMWALGEVFARRRRLFLPAIAIVIALTLFMAWAGLLIYFGLVTGGNVEVALRDLEGAASTQVRWGLLLTMGLLTLAPLAFYLRFRLPFSLGLVGGGAAVFVIIAALLINGEVAVAWMPAILFALGLLLFLAGVAFDARDPARLTHLSDNGFWLHFAAAPLLLNGAFGLIGGLFGTRGGSTALIMGEGAGAAAQAAATLLVVLLLGFISLLINRRALIVSALLTTGVAIGVLMNAAGLGAGALAASTLIVLGAFVLILGAGWHGLRRVLLSRLKPDGMWARIFPPETVAA